MSEYCLRWNNHQPNFVKVFSDLLTTEALVDVTLATDGHFIQAHQLVLSACSVYFRDLFMTNPCRHPIVILKDIRIEDLKTVIDFIYRGEVNVCQERLPDVLKVAGSLRIKGLAENQQTVEEIPSHAGYRPRQQASSSSSVRNDLQSSSQRSSLTDSRELSLSVEGDDQEGAATPPPSKKRKASSQESSESCPDVPEEKPRLTDVKEEPRDDRENDRSHSQETESEYNVGGNGEADDSSSSGIGVSASAGGNSSGGEGASLIPQSQGPGVCRWGSDSSQSLSSSMFDPPKTGSSSSSHSMSADATPLHSPLSGDPGGHLPHQSILQHWSPQFRRMSPSMLLAIDAVRSGKMGFTQAGKTFGVNGRTLWVYYRKLGYEVHNTFRGKKSKPHPPSLGNIDLETSATLRETINANLTNIRETISVTQQLSQETSNRNIEQNLMSCNATNQHHSNNLSPHETLNVPQNFNRLDIDSMNINMCHNLMNVNLRESYIDSAALLNNQFTNSSFPSNDAIICKEEIMIPHDAFSNERPREGDQDEASRQENRKEEENNRSLESLLETYNVKNFWPNHL